MSPEYYSRQTSNESGDTNIHFLSKNSDLTTSTSLNDSTKQTASTVKRDVTPPPQRKEEQVDVVPPSPPAVEPSALAKALVRLSDANADMEFQYAILLQLTRSMRKLRQR